MASTPRDAQALIGGFGPSMRSSAPAEATPHHRSVRGQLGMSPISSSSCVISCPRRRPSMDADDIALFEECKSLCQVKLGCHALNEDYYYNPVDDETRLRPAMTSGCRADLDSGDPIRARLWRGTPERARLQAALQDEDSEDYYRLGELLEEIHGAEFFSDYTYEF